MNLTCGRNPWKQASYEDSTYRAYARSQDFLKTILPVSDELNDILGRIFTRNPDQRITLSELRARILACSRFTEQPTAQVLSTPPASPGHTTVYVADGSAIEDDDDEFDYDEPLSPASSDGESTCSSDEGSLTSSCSSIGDLEEDEDDLFEDIPEAKTPPIYEAPEEPRVVAYHPQQEYMHPVHPVQPLHAPVQPVCAPPKFQQLHQYVWDMLKFAQPPQLHHPVPFHHQVPLFAMQGCY